MMVIVENGFMSNVLSLLFIGTKNGSAIIVKVASSHNNSLTVDSIIIIFFINMLNPSNHV